MGRVRLATVEKGANIEVTVPPKRLPRRGEIWFVKLHVDPPDKGLRPILIVSLDARNRHERADTVLAIPLTSSIHKEVPTHVLLPAAETGLAADSGARDTLSPTACWNHRRTPFLIA